MHPVCNNTKWNELRHAMLHMPEGKTPRWKSKDLNGHVTAYFDGEWYYHFSLGGYKTIEYVDIQSQDIETDESVLMVIRKIGMAAVRQDKLIWRIFGYVADPSQAVVP
jgi:hypothetical protein